MIRSPRQIVIPRSGRQPPYNYLSAIQSVIPQLLHSFMPPLIAPCVHPLVIFPAPSFLPSRPDKILSRHQLSAFFFFCENKSLSFFCANTKQPVCHDHRSRIKFQQTRMCICLQSTHGYSFVSRSHRGAAY